MDAIMWWDIYADINTDAKPPNVTVSADVGGGGRREGRGGGKRRGGKKRRSREEGREEEGEERGGEGRGGGERTGGKEEEVSTSCQ